MIGDLSLDFLKKILFYQCIFILFLNYMILTIILKGKVKDKEHLRAATNESQKTRNKNQETKRFSTFAISRLRHPETKKTLLDRESSFQRNMCEAANQQSISSHMFVYMACKMRCR